MPNYSMLLFLVARISANILGLKVQTVKRKFRQTQNQQTAIHNILIKIFCNDAEYEATVDIQSCEIDKDEMSFTGDNPFVVDFRIEILVSDNSKDVNIIPIVQKINTNIASNNDADFSFEKANSIGE